MKKSYVNGGSKYKRQENGKNSIKNSKMQDDIQNLSQYFTKLSSLSKLMAGEEPKNHKPGPKKMFVYSNYHWLWRK